MHSEGKIWNISVPEEEKLLRKKVSLFDFKKYSKKDINALIQKMRRIMYDANGVGLAANQIGLDIGVFVAKVDNKFYSFFNPKISKSSDELVGREEGCLSVPNRYGRVYRSDKINFEAQDKNGKLIKMKVWGLLATIFQHEVDHLNGVLFIDKFKK